MFVEILKPRGMVSIFKNGNLEVHYNMIVQSGIEMILRRLFSDVAKISDIAIGHGTHDTTMQQTSLENEFKRIKLYSTALATTNSQNDSIEFTASFDYTHDAFNFTEAGLFSDIMIARVTHPVIYKEIYDTITIVWKIVLG